MPRARLVAFSEGKQWPRGLDHGLRRLKGQGAGALEGQRDGGWAPVFAGRHGEQRPESLEKQKPHSLCQPSGGEVFCSQKVCGCVYRWGSVRPPGTHNSDIEPATCFTSEGWWEQALGCGEGSGGRAGG